MRGIVEYINDDVILRDIVCEAKQMIDRMDVSLADCDFNTLNGDDKDVTELHGFPERYEDDEAYVLVTKNLEAGLEYARKNIKKDGYKNAFIVVPLSNCNVILRIKFKDGNIHDGDLAIVGPKDVNIKSVTMISKSAFEFFKDMYLKNDESNAEILEKTAKAFDFLKEKAVQKFNTAVEDDKAAPTPDKSPYTLSKKKRFPEWVKHAYVKHNGKDFIYKNTWNGEADIFVETVKKDGKNYYNVYMGDADGSLNDGNSMMATYYLTSLGQLDKFLEYTLKPARRKKHAEVGADGEIHVWSSDMKKNLPAALKKDIIKDEKLIKDLNFHYMDIFDLYK